MALLLSHVRFPRSLWIILEIEFKAVLSVPADAAAAALIHPAKNVFGETSFEAGRKQISGAENRCTVHFLEPLIFPPLLRHTRYLPSRIYFSPSVTFQLLTVVLI